MTVQPRPAAPPMPTSSASGTGLDAALGCLLVDEECFDLLRSGDFVSLVERYQLTSGDAAALAAIPFDHLQRFGRMLRRKRLATIEHIFTASIRVLVQNHGRDHIADEFWRAWPQTADVAAADLHLQNVALWLNYVRSVAAERGPSWLVDLADYEHLRSAAAVGASPAARSPRGQGVAGGVATSVFVPEASASTSGSVSSGPARLELAPWARIGNFRHDVHELREALLSADATGKPGPVVRDSCCLACVFYWDVGLTTIRLGAATWRILRELVVRPLTGARVDEIADDVGRSRAEVLAVADQLVTARVLIRRHGGVGYRAGTGDEGPLAGVTGSSCGSA